MSSALSTISLPTEIQHSGARALPLQASTGWLGRQALPFDTLTIQTKQNKADPQRNPNTLVIGKALTWLTATITFTALARFATVLSHTNEKTGKRMYDRGGGRRAGEGHAASRFPAAWSSLYAVSRFSPRRQVTKTSSVRLMSRTSSLPWKKVTEEIKIHHIARGHIRHSWTPEWLRDTSHGSQLIRGI